MEFLELSCPRCKANLEIEDGMDTLYCSYCGAKLMVDGMRDSSANAKVRLKEMEHEERLVDKEYDFERFKLEKKAEEEREEERRSNKFLFIGLGMFGLLFLFMFLYMSFSSHQHDSIVSELKSIESDMQADIDAGDYDAALLKANQLRLTDNYSSTEIEAWDDKREYYVEFIRDKKRESDVNNPDMIPAPKSSEDLANMTGEEAKAAFQEAGFTNIELVEVEGKDGWSIFSTPHKVEHVDFGGLTNFTTEDRCKTDSKITIYYYAE